MAFTGEEDHTVSLEEAAEMTLCFREDFSEQTQGVYFSQTTLNDVLHQDGCVGIRFYFALNSNDKLTLAFCGVNADEDDILDIIGDGGSLCPPRCGTSNDLNSGTR